MRNPALQSSIIFSLGRSLVNIQGLHFPMQRDVARWTNVEGPIPVGGRLIHSSYKVPISRINIQGVAKRLRIIEDLPTDPNFEGSYEVDGEEAEVVPNSIDHQSSASPSQPASRRFQSQVIPSTPRKLQQILPLLGLPWLNHRRREDHLPLPFPATQLFQRRENWPIQATREDPNMESEGQDAVARFFRIDDRNSREVITYANDRMIPGTASEEMAAKFSCYQNQKKCNLPIHDMGLDASAL
ncbi:hypothetical protein O181_001246 [Austropuccinia psidii MF-1]|uniref:Uncharacterized protein n=1 Tax=Austropuccinia psidii MF-1 TaxID=1389203 RepID=A0A9Q3GC84_9BASI|nr:hypothetical protein [Austropuccinia psidii MF-1]